ncbi:MAG TPA: phage portal protein, partial [Burkholderiales bacterium]|nr:phage portal protein [Burkholderiales bacterium]
RAHRLYGLSPVEQVALTVNVALRREAATLDYYRTGTSPDAFATLPKEWTADQIRSFQDYFDALMSGNLARRRMLKFMPADFRLIETRQPPLKDQYDEWLARVICYAFSVPATPFVAQVNRATSETIRMQATQEGLLPLKTWIKSALDLVIQSCMGEPNLEFVWVGDDAIDPLQQAQTLNILVSAGIKTRDEARAELGLAGEGKTGAGAKGLGEVQPESVTPKLPSCGSYATSVWMRA